MAVQIIGDGARRSKIKAGAPRFNKEYGANYKSSIEKVEQGKSSTQYSQPIEVVNPNIVKSDYIQLRDDSFPKELTTNKNFLISIGISETNKNWHDQNKSTLEKGMRVANLNQGMVYYNAVVDSKNNGIQLFKADGNALEKSVLDDLYKQFTSNMWVNLNALFEKNGNIWTMKQAVSYDKSKDELGYDSKQIQIPITENGYVDLKSFTEDGLLNKKFNSSNFQPGENIYFWEPVNGRVAGFSAYSDGANLNCDRDPSDRDSDLGVFTTTQSKSQSSPAETKQGGKK